ncbi:MAG: ABC transporter permease [Gemmatimonadota bacterium]|nr:ABC transporter permease [Gemmatimonadota bacterium]
MPRNVTSEIAFHLEMRTREFIESGLSPDDARRAAERVFGDVQAIESQLVGPDTRRAHRRAFIDLVRDARQDVAYSVRALRKTPGFTTAAILTLALGIGANTAIFSVINGVLLRRLPYEGGERLLELHQPSAKLNIPDIGFSNLEIGDLAHQTHTLESVAEYHSMSFNLYGRGEPRRVQTGVVSAHYFSMMGVAPILGRSFLPGEDAAGAPALLILSYSFWKTALGGDPAIVGQTFVMNDKVHTVVGVLPPIPAYPDNNDVYMPISSCPFRSTPAMQTIRDHRMTSALARAKPGFSLEAVKKDLAGLTSRLHADYSNDYPVAQGLSMEATSLREALTSRARPTFLVLLATAGLVLLIACANVANLTFARVLRREREIAVRTALGAGRGRLARQLLTESTLLALVGGGSGLLIAWATLGLLTSFAARLTTRATEISIDGTVLAFAIGASLLTGIILGLLPALPARGDLVNALKDGSSSATSSASRLRLRGVLIVTQVAVAFTLLIGAGLMLRSLVNLERVDPGFDVENVLTARIDLNWTKYNTRDKTNPFFSQLLATVKEMPGVKSAGMANKFPLNESGPFTFTFLIEGEPAGASDASRTADYHRATPDYFKTLGVPLLRGRAFTDLDRLETPQVVLINQSLAKHYFGAKDPIGARVSGDKGESWETIVGVVGDVRQDGLDKAALDEMYVPFEQNRNRSLGTNLLVRTTGDPNMLARRIVEAVHQLDPNQPVYGINTMQTLRHNALASPRVMTTLLGIFAVLALVITATGLAGVIAYTVGQRTHEIGIRMALGAERGEVLAMVVSQGMRLVLVGLTIGALASLALTRLMSGILFGIGPTDPITFTGVFVVLAGVALMACFLPARRATRIDPILALRSS